MPGGAGHQTKLRAPVLRIVRKLKLILRFPRFLVCRHFPYPGQKLIKSRRRTQGPPYIRHRMNIKPPPGPPPQALCALYHPRGRPLNGETRLTIMGLLQYRSDESFAVFSILVIRRPTRMLAII